MSESREQQAVCMWFRATYPKLARMFIPSQSGVMIGGKSKFAIIAKQKREGWLGGVPDIFIAVARGGFHGLWIEMKDVGKTQSSLSKEQKEYLADLEAQGYRCAWCAGAEEAIEVISSYIDS